MEAFPGFILFILFSILTFALGLALQNEPCKSPQYIELSTTAIIRCNFEENAFAILWYNSTDYSDKPIFNFREGIKSGVGFDSEEFDIMNDGSLIIRNVSLRHDHYFTAVKLNSQDDGFIPHTVLAVVTVTPNVTHPHISKCSFETSTCYAELNANENISCAIRDSRPAIPLQWMSRTADNDINVTSTASSSSEGITFSMFAVVSDIFSNHPDLILLVCKATRNVSFLRLHESVILVQRKNSKNLLPSPVIQTFQYNTEVRLTCSSGNSSFLVWKIKTGENNAEVPLAIFLYTENIKETLLPGYHVDNEGSLIITSFQMNHEGVYQCLYGNGLMSGSQSYHATIYDSTSLQTKSIETKTPALTYNYAEWIIPTAVIIILSLASVAAFVLYVKRGKKGCFDPSTLTRKKGVFIKEISAKYKEMCAAVQPVPFIRHRLLKIEDVFVHGGIEFLNSTANQFGEEKWERFNSYSDIFTERKLKSERYILEAAAGYGKSTLCLQMVHDWCNNARGFRFKKVEILIFLRLRQIGEEISIFKAIKHLLLPNDSQLTEEDVRDILLSCQSVLMVLDGYDEYIENCNNSESEITNIMERANLQSFTVVLTTRPSFKPRLFAPLTKRIRLTGFDDNARDQYISKAVLNTACSDIGLQLVKCRLSENPVLRDLCQIPLLFVMFAHLAHDKEEFKDFISATSFFRYIISCIHAHRHNKISGQFSTQEVYNHCKLNKLAFDSLATKQKQAVWIKENIINAIGKDCFEKYVSLGILRVEEVCTFSDELGVLQHEHIRYIENVRFCHDVFCEWYAAHYLANIVSETSTEDLHPLLKHHNLFTLEYIFRFACGLIPAAGDRIIHYFNQINVPDEILILCVIEKTGAYTNIIDTVKNLCSRAIDIRQGDSRITQRATTRILEIAFQNKIEISRLRFWNCLANSHGELRNYENVIRQLLPALKGINTVEIIENGLKLDRSLVGTILSHVSTCKELKTVSFSDCLMPMSLNTSQSMDFEVSWYTMAGEWYTYDSTSSRWKKQMKTEEGLNEAYYMNQSSYEEMIKLLDADSETEEDLEQSQKDDSVLLKRLTFRQS